MEDFIQRIKDNLEKCDDIFIFVNSVAFWASIVVLEIFLNAGFPKHVSANSDAGKPMFILVITV